MIIISIVNYDNIKNDEKKSPSHSIYDLNGSSKDVKKFIKELKKTH